MNPKVTCTGFKVCNLNDSSGRSFLGNLRGYPIIVSKQIPLVGRNF
jgi:hypothetical protein